jgi:Na+-transporting NADH:ubiquinone oxidoreductase subunit NqrB
MNEIRKYYKLIVLILTLFPAMLFSQSILDSVNYHIVYLNSERNRKEVQFNLQKDHSLSNYYRGSYLFIHDELKDQLDSLKILRLVFMGTRKSSS